ncbi:MAG: rRNA pseudouridine synthase [Candidatus Eremiobacteraeota bacterium]|nr:rRNA pseudouridine synthase [Candidatus Eremiobacteraeota bacterium]
MRLQKYLAHAGVASRRKAEEFIAAGHVRVNGRTVRELGTSVVETDRVELAGKLVSIPQTKRYLVLNKPEKVMTTMRDPGGRRTVASLVPREGGRVVPVGRLDYDTSGVLLLTNDGELAHVLTHPKFGVEKTYRALVQGRLQGEDMKRFLDGIKLDDGKSRPAKVRVVRAGPAASEVDVTIHEGRNRQIRRMFEATAHPVLSLVRLRFGPLSLGDMRVGTWRDATDKELAALRAAVRDAEDVDE